jgi:hypothetical protein
MKKKGCYKSLYERTIPETSDGGGSVTYGTPVDVEFSGYIGMLSGGEIIKNQTLGNSGTARLLTERVMTKTKRIVDTNGYFSEAGQVFEVTWVYQNPHEGNFYDLKIVA